MSVPMRRGLCLAAHQMHMKPLQNQVIVITGASSGAGLQLAHRAAKAGANLVLVARSKERLNHALAQLDIAIAENSLTTGNFSPLSDEPSSDIPDVIDELSDEDISTEGTPPISYENSSPRILSSNAFAVVADVTHPEEMEFVAREAIARFGRIDVWVNNAAIATSRRLQDTHLIEKRRIFETNFWGVVHGCRAALPYLRDSGGTLLNIASSDARRSIYCASKRAVRGYSDALRYELEQEASGVQVKCLDVPAKAHSDWIVRHAIAAIEDRGLVSAWGSEFSSRLTETSLPAKIAVAAGAASVGVVITYLLRRTIQVVLQRESMGESVRDRLWTRSITEFQNRPEQEGQRDQNVA